MKPVKIIDLFAGPGGLGEGFSAFRTNESTPFQIALSIEKDKYAHMTLRLRAFWRLLLRHGESAEDLFAYYRGARNTPATLRTKSLWQMAEDEAVRFELGKDDDKHLDACIGQKLGGDSDWVLVGGPPCQAYSLVGRARMGKANENDPRHRLYLEYLKVIKKFRPAIFVMENVKGLLSSKLDGNSAIRTILSDLARGGEKKGPEIYSIHSIANDAPGRFEENAAENREPAEYLIHCEKYGIPQCRHRLVLLGIRNDIKADVPRLRLSQRTTVADAILYLPRLRSGLSRQTDNETAWKKIVLRGYADLRRQALRAGRLELAALFEKNAETLSSANLGRGARWQEYKESLPATTPLERWLTADPPDGWLNHETRSHIPEDLRRYAYVACFACQNGRNPVGMKDFDLPGLAPNHANWEKGFFGDRFKAQMFAKPAATITSHISRDGHAFIHPDPSQCRSLTVREAARLQTFPDNYFFEGPRTSQYVQVGNAVPPFLATQIAACVWSILESA